MARALSLAEYIARSSTVARNLEAMTTRAALAAADRLHDEADARFETNPRRAGYLRSWGDRAVVGA